jgi:hypothetical protein
VHCSLAAGPSDGDDTDEGFSLEDDVRAQAPGVTAPALCDVPGYPAGERSARMTDIGCDTDFNQLRNRKALMVGGLD